MGECAHERDHRGIQVAEAGIKTDHLAKSQVKDTVALFSTMSPDEEILKYKKDEETPKHPK